jgi:DNA modification methylase
MKIEMWDIDAVKPYEQNPRINDKALDAVAQSIGTFGFRQPIVVDEEKVIIAGHTRLLAAKKLGLNKVPVHVASGLTPEQVRAYRIADNKLHELADWDYDLLPLELSDLQEMDVDLELLGFSSDELEKILGAGVYGNEGLTDPDAVPEPPDEPITQPGDLWILGKHRLLCGDSSKSEDVDRLLNGERIHLIYTDPPYNVSLEPRSNNAIAAGLSSFSHEYNLNSTPSKIRAKDRPLKNDAVSDEAFDQLLQAWFNNMARVLEPGRGFYVWGGYVNYAKFPSVLKECGFYFSQAIIWVKEHPALTRKDFMANHEWIFYGWKEGAAHWFNPEIKNATDVWSVKKVSPSMMRHLTEKPVELAVLAMTYSSRPGENVLDLFGGSGSTLIAAEKTGRRAFLLELDALYVDVIVNRWEDFTGRKAERLSTGSEVAQ